jgi:hypothetical protein
MATIKKDEQAGIFDRTVELPELAEALETIAEYEESGKKYLAASNKAKAIFKGLEASDGERIRCGDFILTARARNGGGFQVPAWEGVSIGTITEAS